MSINDEHNYSKIIQLYGKVPSEISIEDVKEVNSEKKKHNLVVDTRDNFHLGDIVYV